MKGPSGKRGGEKELSRPFQMATGISVQCLRSATNGSIKSGKSLEFAHSAAMDSQTLSVGVKPSIAILALLITWDSSLPERRWSRLHRVQRFHLRVQQTQGLHSPGFPGTGPTLSDVFFLRSPGLKQWGGFWYAPCS